MFNKCRFTFRLLRDNAGSLQPGSGSDHPRVCLPGSYGCPVLLCGSAHQGQEQTQAQEAPHQTAHIPAAADEHRENPHGVTERFGCSRAELLAGLRLVKWNRRGGPQVFKPENSWKVFFCASCVFTVGVCVFVDQWTVFNELVRLNTPGNTSSGPGRWGDTAPMIPSSPLSNQLNFLIFFIYWICQNDREVSVLRKKKLAHSCRSLQPRDDQRGFLSLVHICALFLYFIYETNSGWAFCSSITHDLTVNRRGVYV